MAPTLYAADLTSAAKPVKETVEKVKKPRAKKVKAPVVAEEEPAVEPVAAPVKEKKVRTEAQIAASEKMREARRLKKETALADKAAAEKAALEKEEATAAKKEALKEKRRLAREAKKSSTTDAPVSPKVSKKRKADSGDTAPVWLPKFINEIKSELMGDATVKRSKKEVQAEADEKWNDPLVRGRVVQAQDKALNQMYNAVFPGRRL